MAWRLRSRRRSRRPRCAGAAGRRPAAGRADRAPALPDRLHGRRYYASERARALHETLLVADLHADSLLWGRDLLVRGDRGHVDVPRLIEGNVALQVFAASHEVAAPPQHRAQRRPQRRHHPARASPRAGRRATWRSLLARALHMASRAGRDGAPLRRPAHDHPLAADLAASTSRARTRAGRSPPGCWPSRARTRSTATRPTSRSSPTRASG